MRAVFGNRKGSRGGSRVRVISICWPTRVYESRPDTTGDLLLRRRRSAEGSVPPAPQILFQWMKERLGEAKN